MKTTIQPLIAAVLLSITCHSSAVEPTESKTFTLNAPNSGGPSFYTQPFNLSEGDRLELVSASHTYSIANIAMDITFPDGLTQTYYLLGSSTIDRPIMPITLVGPLSFRLATDRGRAFATFDIRRAGAPSNPIPIPQEAGSNFNVILEQSSDLVNWTPANPGSYTGTEPKRFFRTRIVKLP